APVVFVLALACGDGTEEIILATTTSTQDSGLLDELIPQFEKESGYKVKVIAVGSGQALELAGQGEADVVLAHSPKAEEELETSGGVIEREPVMHNDFVIVGPEDDPAGVADAETAADAMAAIAAAGATFISRGDESGTHTKELGLWEKAGVDPTGESWYQETGQGMGATLTVASEKDGYTLTDRGTYLALQDDLLLGVVSEGDAALFNLYHVMVVNPDKHSEVNAEGARAFAAYITSATGQTFIASFGTAEYGEPLFKPDAVVKSE
ncbi:MAG: substrate-binding domain-containing protein, partial [Dehalococcoidia bacterium]